MRISVNHWEWAGWDPLVWFEEDLTTPTYTLIRKGDQYRAEECWEPAISCYQKALEHARSRSDRRLEGSALVHLAEVHHACGELDKAVENYQQAITIFHLSDDPHKQGVACRRLGMIWHAYRKWDRVLNYYQDALSLFTSLWRKHKQLSNRIKVEKYAAWCQEMCVRINEVQAAYMPETRASHKTKPFALPEAIATSQPSRESWDDHTFLEFLPVVSSLAAGQAISISDEIVGYVATNRMLINDTEYILINLTKGERLLRLDPDVQYRVAPVEGDSMDQNNIEKGDYVVLKGRSSYIPLTPEDGDIVAVVILDDGERRATLKRYHRNGNMIVLSPESSNPKHEPYRFETTGDDMPADIVGVAVAVLKRRSQ